MAVLDGNIQEGPWDLRDDVHFKLEWFSGQGAGGQHRNKHQNSARLLHLPTGLVRCAQTRSRANSYAEAMAAITQALDTMSGGAAAAASNQDRKQQIGKGERSDRQRIWRFQHDRVIDTRSGKEGRCTDMMRGYLDKLWETGSKR